MVNPIYPQVSGWEQQLQELGLQNTPFQQSKEPEKTPAEELIKNQKKPESRGERQESNFGGSISGASQDPLQNYGYVDKPGWLQYASIIPGPVGKIGAAANLGINANNNQAVDTARSTLGLEDKSKGFMSDIKGAFKDNQGQVADVAIGNPDDGPRPDYSVGFEAVSPEGRTNLTPQEARTRKETLGGLDEIDRRPIDTEVEDRHKSFIDEASSFFDSLFGEGEDSPDLPDHTDVTPTSRPEPGQSDHETSSGSSNYGGLGAQNASDRSDGRW